MAGNNQHLFQIHHILPNQLFNDDEIQEGLEALFGENYTDLRDSQANKLALYRNASQAEKIKEFVESPIVSVRGRALTILLLQPSVV